MPSIATGKSEGSCLVEWQADSAAQLGGVCQQGGDQTHLEAVCKPEAQAALACGLRVVQMCDDLTEQQGDDGGKHVVDGQGAKGQRRHNACRQATAAGRGERCEQGNKLRLECPRAWRLLAAPACPIHLRKIRWQMRYPPTSTAARATTGGGAPPAAAPTAHMTAGGAAGCGPRPAGCAEVCKGVVGSGVVQGWAAEPGQREREEERHTRGRRARRRKGAHLARRCLLLLAPGRACRACSVAQRLPPASELPQVARQPAGALAWPLAIMTRHSGHGTASAALRGSASGQL